MTMNQRDFDKFAIGEDHPPVTPEVAYVCGFLFNDLGDVALINKLRPKWQAGKLNGIGGHIEPNEDPLAAMIREFKEETDLLITDWRCFAVLRHLKALVYFFTRTQTTNSGPFSQVTDETVQWIETYRLFTHPVMDNLHWLIPLAKCPNKEVVLIGDDTPYPMGK